MYVSIGYKYECVLILNVQQKQQQQNKADWHRSYVLRCISDVNVMRIRGRSIQRSIRLYN